MATRGNVPLRVVKAQTPIYQLRISLLHVKPVVWRRILVPGTIKLSKLHGALLWTMGWAGGHLHEFIIGHNHYGMPDPDFAGMGPPLLPEQRYTLASTVVGLKSFMYLYDYGDGWEHRVAIEKVLAPDPKFASPLCLDGANACPPEDVGGPPGYADFLEAIRDPAHEEHESMLEWCGGAFDPAAFRLEHVNEMLRQIKL